VLVLLLFFLCGVLTFLPVSVATPVTWCYCSSCIRVVVRLTLVLLLFLCWCCCFSPGGVTFLT
jgi:hypothetical protein